MSPKLPDLLTGLAQAMLVPPPAEVGPDYMASRQGLVATLLILAAQEAEKGPAARRWENAAIAALLDAAREVYPATPRLTTARPDASWSELDAENAALRQALIGLHIAAEARGDAATQIRILTLYEEMAQARRLDLMPNGV
jgi:hypothetical protein